jgi:hypothetical protein
MYTRCIKHSSYKRYEYGDGTIFKGLYMDYLLRVYMCVCVMSV